ncbi:MAG: hypothetical protein AB8G22_13485 [Saprospiraceae bacterium]
MKTPKISLKKTIEASKSWTLNEKITFMKRLRYGIAIAIRSVLSESNKSADEKLEAIMWVNEFSHRIDNIISGIEYGIKSKDDIIEKMARQAKFSNEQNEFAGSQIAAILISSYKFIEYTKEKDS